MKNVYWVGGQVFGPTFAGAFGQPVTLTGVVLQPEHLAPGSVFHNAVRDAYPEHIRADLQICVTSVYKFEDAS